MTARAAIAAILLALGLTLTTSGVAFVAIAVTRNHRTGILRANAAAMCAQDARRLSDTAN